MITPVASFLFAPPGWLAAVDRDAFGEAALWFEPYFDGGGGSGTEA